MRRTNIDTNIFMQKEHKEDVYNTPKNTEETDILNKKKRGDG